MDAKLNKRLHAALSTKIGKLKGDAYDDAKANIIAVHTNGRTNSAKELTDAEAIGLIKSLMPMPEKKTFTYPNAEAQPMRRFVLTVGYNKGKVSEFTIGWFEKQSGKKFNELTTAELKKLNATFETITF